jgi:ankyrin repeat protein
MKEVLTVDNSCFCQVYFEVVEKSIVAELVEEMTPVMEKIPPNALRDQKQATKSNVRKILPKNGVQDDLAFRRISYIRQKPSTKPVQQAVIPPIDRSSSQPESPDPPIFTYIKFGQVDIVRSLLENGADPNQQHSTDGSLLQQAARSGNITLAQLILDCGGDINAQGGQWGNALQATCAKVAHPSTIAMVKFLLDNGADVAAQGGYYGNALQAAAAFYGLAGNTTIVELLLDHGADINAFGGEYGTALSVAAYKGVAPLARLLIERGADVNGPSPWGSALQAAICTDYGGSDKVAELLVNSGADVNIQDADIGSPLHAAASKNKELIVQVLVDNGADVTAMFKGKRAIDLATRKGIIDVLSLSLSSPQV